MENLISHLRTYNDLSAEAENALRECFHELVFSKNDFLITEGKTCRHLYFLEKGALRGYYLDDGKEVTHWFAFENDFLTSFHSFITQQPTVENLQLIEGSVLWAITKTDLNRLLNQYHELEKLLRIAYEKYYIRLEEKFINSHFTTAAERYERLLDQQPHILERVSLGQIASYLGISQETLSRIRSKV